MLMKIIKHRLSSEFDTLQILPLADLHIGDIHSDGKKIQEWLTYIGETDNCYTILNGDLMNTAIKSSLSDCYTETLNPMEQLQQCVKLFGPLAEKKKILAVIQGNHEARITKQDSIDITELMCHQLQISDVYSPESALLFIQFGKQSAEKHNWPVLYTLMAIHGSGAGGRMEGGKVNRLVQLANIVDADIYLHSHTHLPAIVKNSYFRVDTRHQNVSKVDRLFVNTSSSIEYGGYGEFFAYKPNSLETPLIILDGKRHKMQAVL